MTGTPMRIAHVIHSLGAGGAETVLTELVGPARSAGMELVVIGLSDAEDDRNAEALAAEGVRVHQLHAGRYDPRAIVTVRNLLTAEGVSLVHTHLKHADVVGGLAAHLAGLPAVSTLHLIESEPSTWAQGVRVRIVARARAWLFERVIALSRAQRAWYRTMSDHPRLDLIPNGVREPEPSANRATFRARLGVPDSATLAVTVSLMRPEKGHSDLLEAMRQLCREDLVLAMAGDGPLLESVRAEVAADPRLFGKVRVLGFRRDVHDLLHAADLVVHPSLADALPTSLISALAAGRPIVATDVGGIPDITGNCALLIPPGDPAALAGAIDALATDPDRTAEMGAAGRLRYEAEFSGSVWAARLAAMYCEVLEISGNRGVTT